MGKGGRTLWLQAAYNPIFDPNGRVVKVVKFASDITPAKKDAEELAHKVETLLEIVAAAASGDLTRAVTITGVDAIGRVGGGLSKLLGTMRESVAAIADNATRVGAAAEELSSVSKQMTSNAQETRRSPRSATSSRTSSPIQPRLAAGTATDAMSFHQA